MDSSLDKSSLDKLFKRKMSIIMFCMLFMYIIWTGIGWNTVTVYAPFVIEDWGIMRSSFMFSVTLISLGHSLTNIFFFGPLYSKLGTRKMFLFPGILAVICFIFYATAQNVFMLYIGGLLLGIGFASLCLSMASTTFNRWGGKNIATKMGIIQTGGAVSGMVFSIVFGNLIPVIGWRASWGITLVIHAVALVVLLVLYRGEPEDFGLKDYVEEIHKQEQEKSGVSETLSIEEDGLTRAQMLRTPNFYMLAVGFILLGIVAYGVLANLTLFAGDFGYGDIAARIFSVALIASAAYFTPGGWIADKFGSKVSVAISMCCTIIAVLILSRASLALPVLIVGALAAGVAYDGCLYIVTIACREAFGSKDFNKKVGILGGIDSIGVAIGPITMTLFYDLTGSYNLGLRVFLFVAIIVMILVFLGTRRAKVPGEKA